MTKSGRISPPLLLTHRFLKWPCLDLSLLDFYPQTSRSLLRKRSIFADDFAALLYHLGPRITILAVLMPINVPTAASVPQLPNIKMEERKRPASDDLESPASRNKKQAVAVNGGSHPDIDMPWKDDIDVSILLFAGSRFLP